MEIRKKLFAASLVALASGRGLTAPGELDATFGRNGLATFRSGYGQAAVQQPDGKLLIATTSRSGDFAVLRLTPDGSPDPSFGSGGIATIDFSGRDEAADLALTTDGKIVVAGTADSSSADAHFAIARLNTDGTLDPSFDGDGRVVIDSGRSRESLSSVLSNADGSVVVTGSQMGQDTWDIVFVRLRSDGALDPTFGTGSSPGTMVVDSGIDDRASQLILLPDGKYLACGRAEIDEPSYVGTMLAVRLNPDGTLDTGFGTGGFARLETDARGYPSAAEACLTLSDGTVVLAGWERRRTTYKAALLMRLRRDGARDTATWDNGLAVLEIGYQSSALAIVALDDDLAISGFRDSQIFRDPQTLRGVTVHDSYVARIDGASGVLDEDFGHHGVTAIDFSYGAEWAIDAQTPALLRQADGKLVAVGGAWFSEGDDSWDGWTETAAARVDPRGTGHLGIAGFAEPSFRNANTKAAVSVRRTGGSTGSLLVDFQTVDRTAIAPNDYTHTRGTLTWGDGDMNPKIIEVPITTGVASLKQRHFDILLSSASSSLALKESRVYPAGQVVSTPTPPAPGGGGATGPETLLLLGAATWLTIRRRLVATPRRECVRPASGAA